jgi:hypothetical protein
MTLVDNPRRVHDPFAPPMIEQPDGPAKSSTKTDAKVTVSKSAAKKPSAKSSTKTKEAQDAVSA